MKKPIKILCADNNPLYLKSVREFLELQGYQVLTAVSPNEAKELAARENFSLAILDPRLANNADEQDQSGLQLARELDPALPKVIFTAFPTWELVRESLSSVDDGLPLATGFISKEDGLEALLATVKKILSETQRENDKMQVFLSYSQKDEPLARKMMATLEQAGLDVWDAKREILPGDNWGEKIGKGLKKSDAMVVLLSPESVESPNVKRDIEYALVNRAFEQRLIPVIVGDPQRIPSEKIPWILRRLTMISLPDNGRTEGFDQVVAALRAAA